MLARVENQGYARRNARERQDMLHGSRLGVLILMMKGRHGVHLPFSQSPDTQNVPSAARVGGIIPADALSRF